MSKVENTNGEFTTKLKDEQFLRFADKSTMGVILIQRGYLQYFNKRFEEIFGYSHEEILTWKKREFYKIVHPDDLSNILQQFKVEDSKTVSVRFKGITKDKRMINLENYVCRMTYNNKSAYLSSYVLLDGPIEKKSSNNRKVKLEIEIPNDLYAKSHNLYYIFKKSLKEVLEKVCNNFLKDGLDDVNSIL